MNAEEHARFFCDGVFVVCEASAVGGADFAERHAALRHDFGDAEAVADFDEFAARDEDFAVAGKRCEDEQNGGGAIIDHDGGLGAGESLDELTGVDVAFPARAGLEVVLEIGILRRGAAEFFDGEFGERCAAQVGVEDDAGRVNDRLERSREDLLNGVGDFVLKGGRVERQDDRPAIIGFSGKPGAEVCQRGAGDFEEEFAIDARGQRGQARLAQKLIDRWDLA